ncbi:MAG: dipeptide epimerase [Saprospiraceae bacterium]|nr:dipeptide epimerase [Saprospiraceae bacterium]
MRLHIFPLNLTLASTFRITHESRDIQPTVIVGLEDNGLIGWGEATAIAYYNQSQDKLVSTLEKNRALIEQTPLDTPAQYWEALHNAMPDCSFELCALDLAAHDLYGKKQGKPVYRIWGLNPEDAPITNYTIGMGPLEEMVSKIENHPWPIYKIKLGSDNDLEHLSALRQKTNSPFRVDANTAWSASETIEKAPILKELGVEFIEQPLPADAWNDHAIVYRESALPIIADESCQTEDDVARCAGHFQGINIKLVKCGGLTPALRMIADARKYGMQVMMGCMTESSIGISAIAQIAPMLDYVDMDGALLLKEDIATGVCIDNGKVYYPDLPGTGASLKSEYRS